MLRKKRFDSNKLDRNNVNNNFLFKKAPLPDYDLIMKIKLYNFYKVYIFYNAIAPDLTILLTNVLNLAHLYFLLLYPAFWKFN